MYEYLTGRLVERAPDEVILDIGGVGYRLLVSGATSGRLPSPGGDVTLYAHHIVRDERAVLFGFASKEERALFERLLGVTKVGPAMALSLLSALEPARLSQAVDEGDVATLSRVKGVGKRTAERLCVELKGRLDVASTIPGVITAKDAAVASALVALGYPRTSAREVARLAVAGAEANAPLEELVKKALSGIGSAQAAAGPPG